MQKFKPALRLALLCAPLALAACQSMPAGYTYQNEVYRAPPGPEATPPANIIHTDTGRVAHGQMQPRESVEVYESTTVSSITSVDNDSLYNQGSVTSTLSLTEQQAAFGGGYGDDGDPEAFRLVADDLISRMIVDFGRPVEPVLVNPTSPMTASLKASMRRHNIPVAAQPGDGPFVIDHSIQGVNATIVFFSNHQRVISESGAFPQELR